MADLARDFDFLISTVNRSISQLEERIAPSSKSRGRGAGLRDHMREALAAIENRVSGSRGRFSSAASDLERESVIDSLRLLNRSAMSMHEAAGWLAAARDPSVPVGVLYFLDEAAAAIVGAETDVVPVGDATYQYATVSWPFVPILAHTAGTRPRPTANVRPIIVFFPPQEAQTTLLHPLLAHELGHSAVDQHQLDNAVLQQHRETAIFREDFDDAAKTLVRDYGIDLTRAQFQLNENLTSWTTEFLCDAIAVEYLGPTYLLAFAATVLATSWSEPSQTHPPTTLRIAAMLEQLKLRGWDPLMEALIPNTFAWLRGLGKAPTSSLSRLERFLVTWMEKFTPGIHATAASRLAFNAYSLKDYEGISPEILDLLELDTLPVQLQDSAPVDRRAILLAGWLQVFELNDDSPSSMAKGNLDDRFQDFIGTAMEMSVILETWNQG